MASNINGALPSTTQKLIKESKILLVGCGGIGCGVLKNLVMLGFSQLEVIDFGTIKVSNLNRQFLFARESVGRAKTIVAKESVLKFNKSINITAHVGDITDQKYGVDFYSKFKLVINAVDNTKARARVNRMCLLCDIPLIESYFTGYSGQVEIMIKGETQCFECVAKPTQKTYPICTIIKTPTKPIHCIIWAKFLFGELFGETEEYVMMDGVLNLDQSDLSSANDETDYVKKSTGRDWAVENNYDSEKLLERIFFDDVNFLLYKMLHLYKNKCVKPVPLDKEFLKQRSSYKQVPEQNIMNVEQNITMFLDSVVSIKERLVKSNYQPLIWDEDDDDFMNFVVSCSNIRAKIFNLPILSHLDIKIKASNIIPATATTDALISGQISMHALRVLTGNFNRCQTVYLLNKPDKDGRLLKKNEILKYPNPKCNDCQGYSLVLLITDTKRMTVRQFKEFVLKQKLNVTVSDVIVSSTLLISSEEKDNVDNYSKYLSYFNIENSTILNVVDSIRDISIIVKLLHKDLDEEDDLFEIFENEKYMRFKPKHNTIKKKKPVDDNNLDNNHFAGIDISDEYVSDEEECVPDEDEYVSDEEECVPDEDEYVSDEEEYVLDEEEYVPDLEEYIPEEYEYVPDEYEYVSDECDDTVNSINADEAISANEANAVNEAISANEAIAANETIAANEAISASEAISANEKNMVTNKNFVANEIKKRKADDEGIKEFKKICIE